MKPENPSRSKRVRTCRTLARATAIALVLATAAARAPATAQTPPTAQTPATAQIPAPQPPPESPAAAAPTTIPEIGRTRATSPACAAMRDLVIPSFAAAQRADRRFAETQKRFPKYAQTVADDIDKNSVVRESQLSGLGLDASSLLQETAVIKKLLDDPRLAPSTKDAQLQAERAALEELYAAQKTRANMLGEFVQREQTTLSTRRVGMEDDGGLVGRIRPAASGALDKIPDNPKMPPATTPPGMPSLTGLIPIADRASLNDWGASAARAVRAGENDAAKAFLPIAQSCR